MNRKRVVYISSGIALLLIIIALGYYSTFLQPKIVFTAKISNVSSEDYKRILDNAQVMYPNKDIDKFKHISVEIKATEPVGIDNNIKIERDVFQQYLKNKSQVQIFSGGSFEHGNRKEYAENIEVYLTDISEKELREVLKDFKYKVTWRDVGNKYNSKVFYLRDYLE